MNLADLHDQAALASVSSDLLDKAASAGVEAMASVLADAMSWTSGDFLPCQSAALEDGARVIAGALARMAIENGLLPEEPSAVVLDSRTLRSTPEYMLAYVALQLLGPSMLPAILALSIHNAGIIGYLLGRHADGLSYRPDAPRGLNLYAYETVPRLYPTIRPGARYFHSLRLLQRVKELDPTMFTKSGIMVGLGEDRQAVLQVMDDMRAADIDFLTIGQYLQPTPKHHAVRRFVTPEEFKGYETAAYGKGFLTVSSTPLTRSSYHAGDDFVRLRDARLAKLGG